VLVPPAQAALCSKTGTNVIIGNKGKLAGGTKGGLVTLSGAGSPTLQLGSIVTGSPAVGVITPYDDSVATTFGVTMQELKAMADASWSSAANFPAKIGDYSLNVVPGPITFSDTRPLRGTGIVVVNGDCSFTA